MPPHADCPPANDLEQHAAGMLQGAAAQRVAQHLAACSHCAAHLNALRNEATLADAPAVHAHAAPPDATLTFVAAPVPADATATLVLPDEAAAAVPDDHTILTGPEGSPTNPDAPPSASATADDLPRQSPSGSSSELLHTAAGAESSDGGSPLDYLAPAQAPGELGRLGPYRVLGVLGRGGMGIVFKAEDVGLKRLVALKAMRPSMAVSERARERFRREAKLTASLEHDHVVEIFDIGEDRSVLFLAMQLLQGESLEARLHREGQQPLAEVLRVGREIATGLAAAHEHGLIHRDVKPANVWLESREQGTGNREQKRVKLLDFGLARALEDETQLTQTGMIAGTPQYMAPEQAEGGEVDARCDLFSLGCVLYRMATGRAPFRGPTTIAILRALAVEQPADPRTLNPTLPPALAALILKLLAKIPDERPASARAVADALAAVERGSGDANATLTFAPPAGQQIRPAPPRPSLRRPEARPAAPRRVWPWLLGGVAVVAAGVLLAVLLGLRTNPDGVGPPQGKPPPSLADALRAEDIPASLLTAAGGADAKHAPRGLVAVFGEPWQRVPSATLSEQPLHFDPVRAVAVSPDGKLIATGSWSRAAPTEGGEVTLWDAATGKLVRKLDGHKGGITQLAFSPDGSTLASASLDGQVKLWDPKTGELDGALLWHEGAVHAVAFSADGRRVVTASADKTVRVWDVESAKLEHATDAHATAMTAAAFAPDGRVVCGGSDGALRIWEPGKERVGQVLARRGAEILSLAVDRGGRFVAVCGAGKDVQLYELDSGRLLHTLSGHLGTVQRVAFSADGKLLASAGLGDQRALVWDPVAGRQEYALRGHTGFVYDVAFSRDGKRVVTGSADRSVNVYELPPRPGGGRVGHAGPVLAVAVSPDGARAVSGGADGSVRVWDVAGRKELFRLEKHTGAVRKVAFSPDGIYLASCGDDGAAHLWTAATGAHRRELRGHGGAVTALAFAGDGKRLATAGADGVVRVWDVESGNEAKVLRGHVGRAGGVAFRPRSDELLSGANDRVIKVWELTNGGTLLTLRGHSDAVLALACRHDGAAAASGGADQTVRVWDLAGGREPRLLLGHLRPVKAVAFRPDGEELVSLSEDGVVFLWDLKADPAERTALPLASKSGRVEELAYFPDGRHLLVGGENGLILVIRIGAALEKQ